MNLRDNPFHVLGARPTDSRSQLFECWETAQMLGDEEKAHAAYLALIAPESRLAAEIRWYPATGDGAACDSPLVRFNAALAQMEPAEGWISLCGLFAAVDAQAVLRAVNADRAQTDFGSVTGDEVQEALNAYGREAARDILAEMQKKNPETLPAQMLELARQLEQNGGANSSLAGELFTLYEISVDAEATRCEENFVKFKEDGRRYTAFPGWMRKGMKHLQRWNELMKPIRLFAALRGTRHHPTLEMHDGCNQILKRMVNLSNFDVAIIGEQIRLECFGDDPEIRTEIEGHIDQLIKMRSNMRSGAISVIIVAGIGLILAIYGWING